MKIFILRLIIFVSPYKKKGHYKILSNKIYTSITRINEAAGFNGIQAVNSALSTKSSIAQSERTVQSGSRFDKSLTIRMHSTQEGMLAAVTANHFECLNSAKASKHLSVGKGSCTVICSSPCPAVPISIIKYYDFKLSYTIVKNIVNVYFWVLYLY